MEKDLMLYEYWLCTADIKELGAAKRRILRKHFGDAREIYKAALKGNLSVTDFPQIILHKLCQNVKSVENLKSEYDKMVRRGVIIVAEWDKSYPERLIYIKDRPDILFVRGRLPNENALSVAIVGSRHSTAYGKEMAGYFAKGLALKGAQIISGMAYGIDCCAHEQTLEISNDTFAVMGCGIDICYPREKIETYEQIRHRGGIISEFAPGTQPLPFRFPMRNRIIAGLADIVIVVEAREKSGSLITAGQALDQGKDVYIVPGRITDPNSRGSNMLWFDGAIPALSLDTILESCSSSNFNKKSDKKGSNISENEKIHSKLGLARVSDIVYSCLGLEPKTTEDIIKETGLLSESVMNSLIELQCGGFVKEPYRGWYRRE